MGLYAAAGSTLIAYFVIFLYRWLDTKKYVKISFDKKNVIESIAIFAFVTVLYYINYWISNMISFIVVVLFAFVTNKENIKAIFQKFSKKGLR